MTEPVREGVLEGGELVTPIPYGDHIHWAVFKHNQDGSVTKTIVDGKPMPVVRKHMPPCEICAAQNTAFGKLLDTKGSDYVAVRITKREAYRRYDRRWPFDMASKAIPLESVEETLGYENNHFERIVGDEAKEAFMDSLTTQEKFIAIKTGEGYRPRDIAALQGKATSNSARWHLFNIRKKAKAWFDISPDEPS